MENEKKLNSLNLLFAIGCIVIASFGLMQAKIIFVPLFASYILYVLLTPLTNYLNKKMKMSRKLYNGILFCILIVLFFLSFQYFWNSLTQLINELSIYFKQVNAFIELQIIRLDVRLPEMEIKEMIQEEISTPIANVISSASAALKNLGQIILLSFVCALFFLFDPHSLTKLQRHPILNHLQLRLRRYMLIKTFVSLTTGLIIAIYLIVLGYKFVFFLGVATVLLNFIPSFGSLIATVLLIPIMGIEAKSFSDIIVPLIFPATVQFVIGNIIEPKLMGDALKLGPIVIILSLIYWGIIFGIYGLFLGVPLTLVVQGLINASDFKEKIYA